MTQTLPRETIAATLPLWRDLPIYAGNDFGLDLVVTDANGDPVDLTDASPLAQIRSDPIDPVVLASFVISIDVNVLHLRLAPDVTATLPSGCAWDCRVAVPDVTTLVAGRIIVTPAVSR